MALGSADEGKPAAEGSVEAWARSGDDPVGRLVRAQEGLRGRFANYVPPVLEQLGGVEVEHKARREPHARRLTACRRPVKTGPPGRARMPIGRYRRRALS